MPEKSTISAIAGIRFATSSNAIIGGETSEPGSVPRLSTQKLRASIARRNSTIRTAARS